MLTKYFDYIYRFEVFCEENPIGAAPLKAFVLCLHMFFIFCLPLFFVGFLTALMEEFLPPWLAVFFLIATSLFIIITVVEISAAIEMKYLRYVRETK